MALAFTPKPIRHPFAPTQAPWSQLLLLEQSPSSFPPQPGSQDPQLNCSRPAGSKGSWASDAIIRAIQSFNDCRTIRKASLSTSPPLFFFYLTGYLYRSLYLTCPNLCFSPPSSSPLLLEAQMLFRSPEGRVELRLSPCWSHTTACDRLFMAVMPAMPCHVTTLSTLERTLII